ncbi:MAG TPA: bifunctional DNA-formamidopyrimidine glycosylase/DNA-(apurinic or apyrimidinic site) lyase, partial [Patescibacteria group bacterium]
IKKLDVLNPKSFLGDASLIKNRRVVRFSRLGKQLSLYLDDGRILHFHLKMTGQLIYVSDTLKAFGHPTKDMFSGNLPNKSTRVVFFLDDDTKLYFNDQRKFGWIRLFSESELAEFQKDLGLDILDPAFNTDYFYHQLQSSSRPIKTVLLDQSKFAGIGNIYANDALFLAKINPLSPANKISSKDSQKIHSAVVNIIKESIAHGGSTARDNKYIRPDGSFGSHQYHFRVYQRAGEPCPVCSAPIKRLSLSGRSVFYCPSCQK